MRRTYLAVAALALVGLLVIAGCGGGGSSSSSGSAGESSGGEAESASNSSPGYGGGYGAAAGGGGESSESSESESEAETETESAAAEGGGEAAVVKVMNTPKLGKVIVDAEGMTLYDFHKDKGTASACYGSCATAWPPLLTTGTPKASGGAQSSLLGTTKRNDGTVQVTYNGHPVYGFIEDQKPGETNGNDVNGFGASWYALQPNGEEPPEG